MFSSGVGPGVQTGALCTHACGSVLQSHGDVANPNQQREKGERMLERNKPFRAFRLMALLEKHSMLMNDNIIIRCNYFMH